MFGPSLEQAWHRVDVNSALERLLIVEGGERRWEANVETSLGSTAIEEAAFAVVPLRLGSDTEHPVWVSSIVMTSSNFFFSREHQARLVARSWGVGNGARL